MSGDSGEGGTSCGSKPYLINECHSVARARKGEGGRVTTATPSEAHGDGQTGASGYTQGLLKRHHPAATAWLICLSSRGWPSCGRHGPRASRGRCCPDSRDSRCAAYRFCSCLRNSSVSEFPVPISGKQLPLPTMSAPVCSHLPAWVRFNQRHNGEPPRARQRSLVTNRRRLSKGG